MASYNQYQGQPPPAYPPSQIAFAQPPPGTNREDDITVSSAYPQSQYQGTPTSSYQQQYPPPQQQYTQSMPPSYGQGGPPSMLDTTGTSFQSLPPQYSPSMAMAPAPVLRDDGEITVAGTTDFLGGAVTTPSASTTTTDRNHETALVPATPRDMTTNNHDPLQQHSNVVGIRAQHHRTYPKEVEDMKVRRKRATIAAGVAGGVVGLVALGPLGMVVGGAGGAAATRAIGKRKERKKREKIALQKIEEQNRNAPPVAIHSSESAEVL